MNNRRLITRIAVYFVLSVVALCFLSPTIILILRSLNFFSEQGFGILSLENYSAILLKSRTIKTFLNGFIISFTQSVIVVVLGFISSFVLARMKK